MIAERINRSQFPESLHSYSFGAMGTSCALQLFADSPLRADMAAALAGAEVERIEAKYSRYKPDSILSTINRLAGEGETVEVDEETAGLLDYSFACHRKSDGLFDITAGVLRRVWNFSAGNLPANESIQKLLPLIGINKVRWTRPHLRFTVPGMEIDLGGIGKEYAVDRLASLLESEGIAHGLIDLGGDFFVLGPHPNGQPWKIGLRDPHDTANIAGEVEVSRGALATSGDYERCLEFKGQRYGHILDPRTGWPVQGLSSVTVVAPQCMVAGAAATIAMLKGHEGIAWLADIGLPHLWVAGEGRLGGNMPTVWSA